MTIKKGLAVVLAVLSLGSSFSLQSCSEPESSLVDFNHTLNSPNDTLYSLLGIINTIRNVADRTILLGEVRGDLTSVTPDASYELKDLSNFRNLENSPYNQISDYYAIIQNCNFFIENADTTIKKHGEYIFKKEYAVVKAYRAWTYLQLAINYGQVPFFTKAILSEKDADINAYPKYDVKQIADFFISDLAPYVDYEYPNYGSMGNFTNSRDFYFNIRVLIGDLCLWAERYADAAKYYHEFLTKLGDTHPTGVGSVGWNDREFQGLKDNYYNEFSLRTEVMTLIPMESSEYNGKQSELYELFNSTSKNRYFYSFGHSVAYDNLSQSQNFVLVVPDPVSQLPDTIKYEHITGRPLSQKGDLRQYSIYTFATLLSSNDSYSKNYMYNYKYRRETAVVLSRRQHVYLRFAEALNRAGYPNAGFAVLKHGLWKDNIEKYIPEDEREAAGDLLSFSEYSFTRENTQGVHSRGCGRADADVEYVIPNCPTKADSILAVENYICDELALETAAEGLRFYDLMRLSMHRNDPTFLASKVANRDGSLNTEMYNYLKDQKNWYLPIK